MKKRESFIPVALTKGDKLNPKITPELRALMLETMEWVNKLKDETLRIYTANSLRVIAGEATLEEVFKEFDLNKSKRIDAAKFTAKQQISTFTQLSNKIRSQQLGITEGTWITNIDGRERKCHRLRNRKKFNLKKGCYSSCDKEWAFPGIPYGCRCTFLAVLPDKIEKLMPYNQK